MKRVFPVIFVVVIIPGFLGGLIGIVASRALHLFDTPSGNQPSRPVVGAISSTITALNQSVNTAVIERGQVGIAIEGTWSGTITFQASYDGGTTWYPTPVYPTYASKALLTSPTVSQAVSTTTTNGTWTANCRGAGLFQATATAWSSGTATIYFNGVGKADDNIEFVAAPAGSTSISGTPYIGTWQTNPGARGVILFANASSLGGGTAGLTISVDVADPVSGNVLASWLSFSTKVLAANTPIGYTIYPGIASGNAASVNVLPKTWRMRVAAGDSFTYTFSVGGCYVP